MTHATDSSPILARPHTLDTRCRTRVRIRGSGELVLHMELRGLARLRRGRRDSVHFEGEGRPRHVSAAEVVISGARGRLRAYGAELDLTFSGGPVSITLRGRFELVVEGAALLCSAAGERIACEGPPARFQLEGALLTPLAA